MRILKLKELNAIQVKDIMEIWNNEYPVSLNFKGLDEFNKYLLNLQNAEHYIVLSGDRVSGWIATFDRFDQKWFVMLIASQYQSKGLGARLINEVKPNSKELYGWVVDQDIYFKLNGQPYSSPLGFYQKMGFEITNEELKNEKLRAIKIKWKVGD